MPNSLFSFLISVFFSLLLQGCGERQIPAQQQLDSASFIIATNGPLKYFAQRLLEDKVEVRMLVPEGTDPAEWRPDVDAVLQLQKVWQYLEKIIDEKTLFIWEAEPSKKISIHMSEMSVASVVVDPGANPAGTDWLMIQKKNLASLQQVELK